MTLPASIAPLTEVRSRFWLRNWASFTLFTMFAGQFLRNLIGYPGYYVVAVAVGVGGAIVVLSVYRPNWNWRRVPKSAFAFVGFATLSVLWSFYPGVSALAAASTWATGTVGVALVLVLSWPEFVRCFAVSLRWHLALGLLFELWVALFVRAPLLPNFVHYEGKIPMSFYWTRDLLFHGGPIDGIVANKNLFGFVALLALIVFCIQLAAKTVRRGPGIFWITVAVVALLLTRSATVFVALIGVALVLTFALWMRRRPPARRAPVYLTALGVAVAGSVLVWIARAPLLGLLGKSDDFTGRFTIWDTVANLAVQRPVFGWGWTSYWAPWVKPFNDLVVIKGVTYLQAHNTWLDVWMQLGVIGLILFIALVGSTMWRSWFLAVDRPTIHPDQQLPYGFTTLLPLLLVTALVVQSFAESRLLIEGNLALLIGLAFVTKRQFWRGEVWP